MKKIILSLTALLAVGAASAQSYPKQPDRTVVNYVEYKKEAKPETEQAQSQPATQATVESVATPTQQQTDEAANVQPAASVNGNTVSENRRDDKRRKE